MPIGHGKESKRERYVQQLGTPKWLAIQSLEKSSGFAPFCFFVIVAKSDADKLVE